MAFIESGRNFDKDARDAAMKLRMDNMDVVQYTLRVPKDMHTKARIKLIKEEKTLRSLLLEAIKKYIDE